MMGFDRSEWKRPERPDPADRALTGAYRLLGLLLIVAIAAVLLFPGNDFVQKFAPNAATEMLGIVITLAFVQRLLYRQERARRMRASIGAYRRGGWALNRLVAVWADTIKGCSKASADTVPRSVDRLFAPHHADCVGLLDPCAPSDVRAGAEDSEQWIRYLGRECEQAADQLNRVILSYSSVLDPAYTEAIDEVIDHPFLTVVFDLARRDIARQEWRTAMNFNRGHREDFFHHLVTTVQLHNALAAEAATVRSRGRAPRSGMLGMELARDGDLVVPHEFTTAWSTAFPAPGLLAR